MKKVINSKKTVRYFSFFVLAICMMLLVPALASAVPEYESTATVEMALDAENVWYPIVQTGSAPQYTLYVGESTQATFNIQARHAVDVNVNLMEVYFHQTVTEATYINSLDIYLEEDADLDGVYEKKYIGRDGQPVRIQVVSSPQQVTDSRVIIPYMKGTIDISTSDTVGKDMRWAVYMTSTINGVVTTDEYIGEQQDVHWHKP